MKGSLGSSFSLLQQPKGGVSKLIRIRDMLAELLKLEKRQVDMFSVLMVGNNPPMADVRFSAHSARYYNSVRLHAAVLLHRAEVPLKT